MATTEEDPFEHNIVIKGHEVNLSKFITQDAGYVPEREVLQVLKNNSTTSKIRLSVTKDFFRPPRLLAAGMDRGHESLLDLIARLRFKFFERFSDLQKKELVKVMNIQYAREGDYIIRKGDIGDKVYFIFLGRVDVIVREGDDPVATLGQGQSFGELALLYDTPRQATIRCQCSCAFATLARDPFNMAVSHQRLLEENRVVAHLANTPPFAIAPTRLHMWMADVMQLRRVNAGYTIPPSELETLFVVPVTGVFELRARIKISAAEVIRGLVRHRVVMNLEDADKIKDVVYDKMPILLIKKGDFFGEDLLLEPNSSVEEVRAWVPNVTFSDFYLSSRDDGKFLAMNKNVFQRMMDKEKTIESHLRLRTKIQMNSRKEQMNRILLLVNRPDYAQKSAQYMKQILMLLEESLVKNCKRDIDAYDEKVLNDGKLLLEKRRAQEELSAKWDRAEKQLATQRVKKMMLNMGKKASFV